MTKRKKQQQKTPSPPNRLSKFGNICLRMRSSNFNKFPNNNRRNGNNKKRIPKKKRRLDENFNLTPERNYFGTTMSPHWDLASTQQEQIQSLADLPSVTKARDYLPVVDSVAHLKTPALGKVAVALGPTSSKINIADGEEINLAGGLRIATRDEVSNSPSFFLDKCRGFSLTQWLLFFCELTDENREKFVLANTKVLFDCPVFLEALTIMGEHSPKTIKNYCSKMRTFVTWLKTNKMVSPQVQQLSDIEDKKQLPQLLSSFGAFLATKRYSKVHIRGLRPAYNWLAKILGLPLFTKNHKCWKQINVCTKFFSPKPKNTQAWPLSLLREFLLFVFQRDKFWYHRYIFFLLTAARPQEIVYFRKSNGFVWTNFDWDQKRRVSVRFYKSKMKQDLSDFREIVFTKLSPKAPLCPYRLCELLNNDLGKDNSSLLPWQNVQKDTVQDYLGKQFNSDVEAFQKYIYKQKGWNLDNLPNRLKFYSFRVTFSGICHNFRLSHSELQKRMGHTLGSATTRDIYVMNALLTTGFDSEFDQFVENSLFTFEEGQKGLKIVDDNLQGTEFHDITPLLPFPQDPESNDEIFCPPNWSQMNVNKNSSSSFNLERQFLGKKRTKTPKTIPRVRKKSIFRKVRSSANQPIFRPGVSQNSSNILDDSTSLSPPTPFLDQKRRQRPKKITPGKKRSVFGTVRSSSKPTGFRRRVPKDSSSFSDRADSLYFPPTSRTPYRPSLLIQNRVPRTNKKLQLPPRPRDDISVKSDLTFFQQICKH